MYNIEVRAGEVVKWEVAFPEYEVGQHGKEKVGFEGMAGYPNPHSVCVGYNSGGQLLEVLDFDSGDSVHGNTLGGDRDYVIADKPFALAGDSDCHILGVVRYRNGTQPKLYVDGVEVEGGASRFTSFVSETGAADEDPKPQHVSDEHGNRVVNRDTGHAAWGDYYVHIVRLEGDDETAPLTLQAIGHTPKTDTTFPKPEAETQSCPACGAQF